MSEHDMTSTATDMQSERGLKSPLLTPIIETSPVKEADVLDFLSTRLSLIPADHHAEYGYV